MRIAVLLSLVLLAGCGKKPVQPVSNVTVYPPSPVCHECKDGKCK